MTNATLGFVEEMNAQVNSPVIHTARQSFPSGLAP